jgi:hypothetical protein
LATTRAITKKTFEFGKNPIKSMHPTAHNESTGSSIISANQHHHRKQKNLIEDYSSIERGKDHDFKGPSPKEDLSLGANMSMATAYKKIAKNIQQQE